MLTDERQLKILEILWNKVVVPNVVAMDWGWTASPDSEPYYDGPILARISPEEITVCATTSCQPPLWALRALAKRKGIDVRKTDWWFYNMREI